MTLIRRHNGFTLIELLVVIAVISMLLAILLPSLRMARALTKRISCQSNLRNIAFAWKMYLDDYNGGFYQGRNANLNYGGWQGIAIQTDRPLNQYLNLPATIGNRDNAKVFLCPADRGGAVGWAPEEKAFNYYGTSYQTNIMLIGQNQVQVLPDEFNTLHQEINMRLRYLTIDRVDNPSRLLLIGDYGWLNIWKPPQHPNPDLEELAEWHSKEDCHNMAFLDGHISFLHIQKGLYITDEYVVLPFKELYEMALEAQSQSQ